MDNQLIDIMNQLSKLDYGKILFNSFGTLICYYGPQKVISAYRLHKDFKPKDISKVSIPLELEQNYTDIEIGQIGSKKIKEAVLEFADILIKEFPTTSLVNFYNNVNEVKIKRNIGMCVLFDASGVYSCKENKINYFEFASIYHELFHMASSYYDKTSKLAYSGFGQHSSNNYIDIGSGINEGYTELMTYRYFGKQHKLLNGYRFEVGIVDKLEKIVGQDEMEKLYLSANLMGLIKNLKQYATEEDILKFIGGVDLVNEYSSHIHIFKNDKVTRSIVNVYEFLLKTYITKLKQQLEKGIINNNEFIQQSTQYIKSIGTSVNVGGYNYEYLTVDSLHENLEKVANTKKMFTNNEEISNLYKR